MKDVFDDLPRPDPKKHEIGQDLSQLSVEELAERISALQGEIARLEAARSAKQSTKSAAESLFKL